MYYPRIVSENCITDAPAPVSQYNDETLAFNGHTTAVFGSPGHELRFKIAVRSFPSPAVVSWPSGITLTDTIDSGKDITVFDLSVVIEEDMTFTASGRNGASGQLTSEIFIRVGPRRRCHFENPHRCL